jgi:uncharacterized protein (TIGR00255 family)
VLLSMTGFGEARRQGELFSVAVELRALNNRYLKVTVRASEPYHLLEPEIEKVLRNVLRRGTVQVSLQVRRQPQAADFRVNEVALRAYRDQLAAVEKAIGATEPAAIASLLALPGVVPEPEASDRDISSDWPQIEPVLQEALTKLQAMRQDEGRAMEEELLRLCGMVNERLGQIRARAPAVAECFRDKLYERVRNLLAQVDVEIDKKDVIREVALFAERSDIGEEIVRLGSHVRQFHDIVHEPESTGRKLEFLIQELFREANTIGSKANDVEIARHVVEIKGAIEKMRELIQNVE